MMVDFFAEKQWMSHDTLRLKLAHRFHAAMALSLIFCSLADASFRGYLWSPGHSLLFSNLLHWLQEIEVNLSG